MRVVVAFILLGGIVVVLTLEVGRRARAERAQRLDEQIEQLGREISRDVEQGVCDFSRMHEARQLLQDAAAQKKWVGQHPYTRTSGVVSLDEVPQYIVESPRVAEGNGDAEVEVSVKPQR